MIRLLLATGIASLVSLVGTKLLITALTRRKIAQPIHEDVPEGHIVKVGTPTMGGLAIVAGCVVGYIVSDAYDGVFTWTGIISVLAIAGAGVVGFLDDWIKIRNERNLGLSKRAKMLGLLTVAVGFAVLMVWRTNVHTTISFTQWNDIGWNLGKVGWCVWAVLLIAASSNAVNLTDGLDGLAAGSAALVFGAYVVIGYWIFRHPGVYGINVGLDLAVVAAAMMGACASSGGMYRTCSLWRVFSRSIKPLAPDVACASRSAASSMAAKLFLRAARKRRTSATGSLAS